MSMLGLAQVAAIEEMTTMRPPLGMTGAIDLTSDAGARTLIAIVLWMRCDFPCRRRHLRPGYRSFRFWLDQVCLYQDSFAAQLAMHRQLRPPRPREAPFDTISVCRMEWLKWEVKIRAVIVLGDNSRCLRYSSRATIVSGGVHLGGLVLRLCIWRMVTTRMTHFACPIGLMVAEISELSIAQRAGCKMQFYRISTDLAIFLI
ncbi:hypothetical protein KCU74_g143, partial [Aureobasidium melanogenum]